MSAYPLLVMGEAALSHMEGIARREQVHSQGVGWGGTSVTLRSCLFPRVILVAITLFPALTTVPSVVSYLPVCALSEHCAQCWTQSEHLDFVLWKLL